MQVRKYYSVSEESLLLMAFWLWGSTYSGSDKSAVFYKDFLY